MAKGTAGVREIELKLDATGQDVLSLARCAWLRDAIDPDMAKDVMPKGRSRASWLKAAMAMGKLQIDTYWDTSDRRLRRHGFTLRTRQSGDVCKQTLKLADNRASISMNRAEWEMVIEGKTPDLSAFGDPSIFEALGAIWPHQLVPLFSIRNKRTRFDLLLDGYHGQNRIEMAIDDARVKVGSKDHPFQEMELELKAGDPAAVIGLARRLCDVMPFAVHSRSKADRGFALIDDEVAAAMFAVEPSLRADMPATEALAAILQACIGHAFANIEAAHDARDVEGVHQLRVALRRGQAALSLFRPEIEPEIRKRWSAIFKDRRRPLGLARDLDVLRHEMMASIPRVDEQGLWIEALEAKIDAARAEAQAALRAALEDPLFSVGLLDLATALQDEGVVGRPDSTPHSLKEFACQVLDKALKKARKLAAPGVEDMEIERLHALRLQMKTLRYGVDFFSSIYPAKQVKPFRKALKELQDLLGQVNDVEVATARLDEILKSTNAKAANRGFGLFVGWFDHELRQRRAFVAERWARFDAQVPFWRDDAGVGKKDRSKTKKALRNRESKG